MRPGKMKRIQDYSGSGVYQGCGREKRNRTLAGGVLEMEGLAGGVCVCEDSVYAGTGCRIL